MLIRAGAVSVSVSGPRVEDTRPSPLTSPHHTNTRHNYSRPINTSTLSEGREYYAGKNCNFQELIHGGGQKSHSAVFKNSEESRNAPRDQSSSYE